MNKPPPFTPEGVTHSVIAGEDGLKICSKCRQPKDPSEYGKHPSAADGLQTACKDCYASYQRERRKNPDLKAKDRAAINRAMAKRQDYYTELHNEARRKRRQDPEARAREQATEKEWRDRTGANARTNHARRARKVAAQVMGPVPGTIYQTVLGSGPCVYCGAPAATVDHITPL